MTEAKREYFGLDGLDQRLESYLNYDNGFFVELGANDGVRQSNTLYFEKYRGWSGVLIEPIPHRYMECLENRGEKNTIFCNACVPFDYDQKYVDMLFIDLMSVSENLSLDIGDVEEHVRRGESFLQRTERTVRFGAVAATLNHLLHGAGAPKTIDLLSLDVEGAELDVLRGIDLEVYEFNYMLIESRAPTPLVSFLNQHNYEVVDMLSKHDYLFSRQHGD